MNRARNLNHYHENITDSGKCSRYTNRDYQRIYGLYPLVTKINLSRLLIPQCVVASSALLTSSFSANSVNHPKHQPKTTKWAVAENALRWTKRIKIFLVVSFDHKRYPMLAAKAKFFEGFLYIAAESNILPKYGNVTPTMIILNLAIQFCTFNR